MAVVLVRTHGPLLFFCFEDFGVCGILGKVRNSLSEERGFLIDTDADPPDEDLFDVPTVVERLPVLEGVCTLVILSGLLFLLNWCG